MSSLYAHVDGSAARSFAAPLGAMRSWVISQRVWRTSIPWNGPPSRNSRSSVSTFIEMATPGAWTTARVMMLLLPASTVVPTMPSLPRLTSSPVSPSAVPYRTETMPLRMK